MTALQFRAAALAVAALPVLLLAGCSPECVDAADCASKAEAAPAEFTCVANKCVEGSPFNDGGVDEDGGTGGGGGSDEDAGTGGGGGGTSDGGGTTGGGGGSDGGNTDAGADAGGIDSGVIDDGGVVLDGGPTPGLAGAYAATLNGAQAGSASSETGTGLFTVQGFPDGGYTFAWQITHTAGSGGATSGGIRLGLAGFPGTAWITFPSGGSPILGSQPITPAQASDVREGRAFVQLVRQNLPFRGQIIPAGNRLWTARLDTLTPSGTFGGAQFVVPIDGGSISYLGEWSSEVEAQAAHLQQGGPGGSGAVLLTLALTADAGGVQGTFEPATLAAGDVDGGLQVNVSTTDAGAGFLRGQIVKH